MFQVETIKNINHLKLAFEFIKDVQHDSFAYIYNGLFTRNITSAILALNETNLQKIEPSRSIRKRIFFLLVECLQNITRHQIRYDVDKPVDNAIFIAQRTKSEYRITTGNLVTDQQVEKLQERLDSLNNMKQKELEKLYQETLINGKISDLGGAGLGFIAMARRTNQKFVYKFVKLKNSTNYFYLQLSVPFEKTNEILTLDDESIDNIIQLHYILKRENILLNFNGAFNKENVLNFIPVVQEHIAVTTSSNKSLYNIMVEMLQNIVKYGDNHLSEPNSDLEGNPGIFFIGSKQNHYFITAGNYIDNRKINTLRKKIDFVNYLSIEKLKDFQSQISEFFNQGEINKPDLSIIDMRLLSSGPLNYRFFKVNGKFSFFVLQSAIEKELEIKDEPTVNEELNDHSLTSV